MKSEKPLISVIVPHLNQPSGLEACLRSLHSQTLERSAFEVIVVDNGSNSLPAATISQFPSTFLLQERIPGPGMARNRGIEAASADILAFIDADCRAHPDWLRSALRALRLAPERTILGGDVQIWREGNAAMTALEAYESVFAYRFKLYIEQHGFSGTGNLVVRHSDFDEIGAFRGIEIAEDVDWGQRARAAGFTFCYVPEMIVYHPARKTLRELFVKWNRHIQHAVSEGDNNAAWRAHWVFRASAVLISPLVDWTKVIASDRIHGVTARIKAIFVLVAIRAYRAYKMISLLLFSKKGVVWNRASAIVTMDHHHDITSRPS
jgi:glycosyltransferase involved in cell wall biosynthesis